MKKRLLASILTITMLMSLVPVGAAAETTDVTVGSYMTFGTYEQDNDLTNGAEPIEWSVLAVEDGKALLLSRYELNAQPFNEEKADVSWEDCTLRTWLNDDFYNTAFSSEEKSRIQLTTVQNPDSYWGWDDDGNWVGNNTGKGITELSHHAEGGDATEDMIFLLSLDEVQTYLDYSWQTLLDPEGDENDCHPGTICIPTDYAVEQGAWQIEWIAGYNSSCWWLRSPCESGNYAGIVYYDGDIDYTGTLVDDIAGVRPAMWVSLSETDNGTVTPDNGSTSADTVFQFADDTGTGTWGWASKYIYAAYDRAIFKGDNNGNFNPDNNLTRAEAVTALLALKGVKVDTSVTASGFTDADGQWYTPYVAAAKKYSISSGYDNGNGTYSFKPNANISRAEFVTMLLAAMGVQVDTSNKTSGFTDADGQWYTGYVAAAKAQGLSSGYDNGNGSYSFRPNANISRAEAATMTANVKIDPSNNRQPDPSDKPDTDGETEAGDMITVGGRTLYIGEPAAELGTPDEVLASTLNLQWYVYNTSTYQNFFAAGVKDGTVVALIAAGLGFDYCGVSCGGAYKECDNTERSDVYIGYDVNENDLVHSVMLLDNDYGVGDITEQAVAGESKLNFYLTNAFRVYHGLSSLRWDDKAAEAARLHSVDMADYNYFEHESRTEDTRYPAVDFQYRLDDLGINYRGCGENIAAGNYSGFGAYCGWINSYVHRENILSEDWTHLGVGGGYNDNSAFGMYLTQDFWF